MTAFVPAYRCGTVPDSHRVPSRTAPQPGCGTRCLHKPLFPEACRRQTSCAPSSSTALGRVVSKSISFAYVGTTAIRTLPAWLEPFHCEGCGLVDHPIRAIRT